jgi:hypothetical protein
VVALSETIRIMGEIDEVINAHGGWPGAFATEPTPNSRDHQGNGKPEIVATYNYQDEHGDLLYQICRMIPKDFRQRKPKAGGGWEWSIKGVRRVLYRLPELLSAVLTAIVFIVEGEKDVDSLVKLGLVATCNSGGADSGKGEKWLPNFNQFLRGRRVAILPDQDNAGRKHGETVARGLQGVAAEVKVVELPGPGKDVSDWLDAGGTVEELLQIVEAAPLWTPAEDQTELDDTSDGTDGGEKKRTTQATLLVQIVEAAGVELWHDLNGDSYATIIVGEHREHALIKTKSFRRWLARQYYLACKSAPGSQVLQDAIAVLEGKAIYDGVEHPAPIRIAELDGRIYLDLCNPTWQVVEIDTRGWRVVSDSPVRFRRSRAMLALVEPTRGGSVENLRKLLNVSSNEWALLVAWILAAYRPTGPYPVLCLHGEQGSGKSTAARVIRTLVDPNTAPLRCEPREPRDLAIAANNGWIVALDNVSRLSPWLSDGICRLSTGGGFSTRELYTDCDEQIFNAMRPVVLNGIEEIPTRSDIIDRALLLTLPTIPESCRRTEVDFWREFSTLQPGIIGSLLTAVSAAMRNLPTTKLDKLPRLADFALLSVAAEEAIGLAPGSFMASYTENRRLKTWPQTPRSLSGILKRLAPNLRVVGIDVDLTGHTGRGSSKRRSICLLRTSGESCVPTVPTVPNTGKQGKSGDTGVDGDDELSLHSKPDQWETIVL